MFTLSIQSEILSLSGNMSKKLSQLGKYIVDNIFEASFMNSTQIALNAGVSEATVTRFVYRLGYKNFSEFQLDLRKETQKAKYISSWQEFNNGECEDNSPFREVYKLETALMAETFDHLDPIIFDSIVEILSSSDMLFLIGGSTHTFLSLYAYNFMSLFRENVHLVSSLDLHFVSLLDAVTEKSAALVFSYPRYPVEMQRIVATLASKNLQIIGMTDSVLAPIIPYCSHYLVTPQKYLLLGEANAVLVALIHSMLLGMYRKNPEGIKKKLEEYERNILALDMFTVKNYNFTKKFR